MRERLDTLPEQARRCVLLPKHCNTWCNEVDMIRNGKRKCINISAKVVGLSLLVFINVVLRLKHRLQLTNCGVEPEPALILCHDNLLRKYAHLDEPFLNNIDRVLARAE